MDALSQSPDNYDANTLADALFTEALEAEAREYEQTAAAIQEGLDAGAAEHEKPLAQYIAEQRAKRGLPDTWPPSTSLTETEPGVVVALE